MSKEDIDYNTKIESMGTLHELNLNINWIITYTADFKHYVEFSIYPSIDIPIKQRRNYQYETLRVKTGSKGKVTQCELKKSLESKLEGLLGNVSKEELELSKDLQEFNRIKEVLNTKKDLKD